MMIAMDILSTLLIIYMILFFLNAAFACYLWARYRTRLYKMLVGVWTLTLLNFFLQHLFLDSELGSVLSFASYILVVYCLCSILAQVSSLEFKFRYFFIFFVVGVSLSCIFYVLSLSFAVIALPTALAVAVPQLYFALNKLVRYPNKGTELSNFFAVLLLISGVHFLDFPFLRPLEEFAVFGYGVILVFSMGFAALLPTILGRYHADELSSQLMSEIEKRRTTEQELADALEQAKRLADVKSEFLANMSHEIRTPLNVIVGLNELMSRTPLNEDQRAFCDNTTEATTTLLGIINNILSLSKLESGTVPLNKQEISSAEFLAETLKYYENKNLAGIEVCGNLIGPVPHRIIIDKVKVQQIIFNLVNNAIKYSESNIVSLTIQYEPSPKVGQGKLTLTVSDQGIGISPEITEKLFDRYSQQHLSQGGYGLGLAIVKELIYLMDGTIVVESEINKGTCFRCEIPVHVGEECFSPIPPEIGEMADKSKIYLEKPVEEKSILIVEDDTLSRKIYTKLLQGEGYVCEAAATGTEALRYLKQKKFSLVLSDIQLPDFSGFDIISELQQRNDPTPVIIFSAFAFDEDVHLALERGATDYLRKPSSVEEIKSKIEACIA